MDARPIIDTLRHYFAEHPAGIVCAYLFGSVARGEAKPDSDIDLAVLLEQAPPPTLPESGIALAGAIESESGLPLDLVLLNSAAVDLSHRVLRDGILVYDGKPRERIRFEVKARNEYFDLKPYLDQYRRAASLPHG